MATDVLPICSVCIHNNVSIEDYGGIPWAEESGETEDGLAETKQTTEATTLGDW